VTATVGTGTMNLGAASSGFRSFAQAVTDGALASGATVYYGIQDGINWENGSGTYTAGSPDTLTRTVSSSSAGGVSLISLSGSAIVAIVLNQMSVATQALGDNSNNLATTAFVQGISGGTTTQSIAGSTTPVNLSATQAGAGVIIVNGAITGNINVTVPATSNKFLFSNQTTGAFTVTITTPSGTGITVPSGTASSVYCDGTNILNSSELAVTQPLNDSSTFIATTAFVQGISGGLTSVSVAGSINVTLTPVQAATGIIVLTGAIGASISVIVPTASNKFTISNTTSGAFTITVKTAAGTGIIVGQGFNLSLFCDGTNVVRSGNDFSNVALTGGTINGVTIGATTATTGIFTSLSATSGINNTTIGVTTPLAGKFTTLTASSGITSTAIGASSPSTGAFTTLSATGAVSGAGFSTFALLASPTFSGTPTLPTGTIAVTQTAAGGSGSTAIATTAFVRAVAGQAGASIQWTGGTIVTNGTYYFSIYTPYPGTINSMDYFTQASTSFIANVEIAGTSVTSLSAITVNSATQANTAASGANTFTTGQVISVVITSATGSPTAAVLSLRITKS
jgi:hypothetical protein